MIRRYNIDNRLENLKDFLTAYIRNDPEDFDDGMLLNVKTCTKTISGTEYYGVRCTAQMEVEVNVVDFYLLNDGTFYVEAYYNGRNPASIIRQYKQTSAYNTMPPLNKLVYAYGTDNGCLLNFQTVTDDPTHPPVWLTVMITKGSDGYPFVVFPNTLSTYLDNMHYDTIITHVSDSSYGSVKLFMVQSEYQTALCPFMTYGNQFDVVSAPYAFWAVQATDAVRNGGFAVMKFNSETDGITNGYWVIFDGAKEADET